MDTLFLGVDPVSICIGVSMMIYDVCNIQMISFHLGELFCHRCFFLNIETCHLICVNVVSESNLYMIC